MRSAEMARDDRFERSQGLRGRVAIVTGASRGIGAAATRAFATAGARVVLAARDEASLSALCDEIGGRGGKALVAPTDVTDADAVERLVATTIERFGRLDLAFNNAGGGHRPSPLADVTVEDFERAIDANLRSVFLCLKFEIRAMLAGSGGAIVNMASSAGLSGAPGMGPYAAAKHGVIGLTETAAIDYAAHNIRVNALAPGPIATQPEMAEALRTQIGRVVPLGRMGTPDEVAAAAVWLCSDEASFITGTTLRVDGGKLSRAA
jgi:NAD(P)-dependent dehydrogenase (short-subunit alcohol dehydrogenase family)